VISGLENPLPDGFIRVVYLDCCNSLPTDGRLAEHRFDSEEWGSQLEHWLTSGDREKTSYAVSACAALPFLSASARERLVDLASRHSDAGVRIEAAWVCAKSRIGGGVGSLVEFARDPRHSKPAISYLEEGGLAGQIPAECAESPNDSGIVAVEYFVTRTPYSHVIFLASLFERYLTQACHSLARILAEGQMPFTLDELAGDKWTKRRRFLSGMGDFGSMKHSGRFCRPVDAISKPAVHEDAMVASLHLAGHLHPHLVSNFALAPQIRLREPVDSTYWIPAQFDC
jgi:hypothetical protein